MQVLNPILRACLAMAALTAMACAHAADGFTVQQEQEKLITPGMSRDAVRNAIGRPSTNVKYPNDPARTWTYNVAGTTDQRVVFEVDFNRDDKVEATHERALPPNEGSAH